MTKPQDDLYVLDVHKMMMAAADNYSVTTYHDHLFAPHEHASKVKALINA